MINAKLIFALELFFLFLLVTYRLVDDGMRKAWIEMTSRLQKSPQRQTC